MKKNYESNLTHAPTVSQAVQAGFVPVIAYRELTPGSWQREEADKGRPFYGPNEEWCRNELERLNSYISGSVAVAEVVELDDFRQAA